MALGSRAGLLWAPIGSMERLWVLNCRHNWLLEYRTLHTLEAVKSDYPCAEKHDTVEVFSSGGLDYFCKSTTPLGAVTDTVTSCQKMLRGGLSAEPQINDSPKQGVPFHPSINGEENRERGSHKRSNREEGRRTCLCAKSATSFHWIQIAQFQKGKFPLISPTPSQEGDFTSRVRHTSTIYLWKGSRRDRWYPLSPGTQRHQSMNVCSPCGKEKVARCSGDPGAEAIWYSLRHWTAGSGMALGEERWPMSAQGTGFLLPWSQMSMLAFLQSVQQSVSKAAFAYTQPQQSFGMVASDLT